METSIYGEYIYNANVYKMNEIIVSWIVDEDFYTEYYKYIYTCIYTSINFLRTI